MQQQLILTTNDKQCHPAWFLPKINYKADTEGVVKLENKEGYYAVIAPKLLKTLDPNQLKQCEQALKKGIVSKNFANNGIKLIMEHSKIKIIELKINADLRLYTSKIYKNKSGDYLIEFDQEGTHATISKVTKEVRFTVIETEEPQSIEEAAFTSANEHELYVSKTDSVEQKLLGAEMEGDHFDV